MKKERQSKVGYSINYHYLNNEFPNFLKSYDITSKYDALIDAYASGVAERLAASAGVFFRSLFEGYYKCLNTNINIDYESKGYFKTFFEKIAEIIRIDQTSSMFIVNNLGNQFKHRSINKNKSRQNQSGKKHNAKKLRYEDIVKAINNLINILGQKIQSNILNGFILNKGRISKKVKVIKKTQKVKVKEYVDPTKKIDIRENKYDRSAEGQDRRISSLKAEYGNTSFFDFSKKREINQKIKQAKNNKKQLIEKSYQCNKSRITSLHNERKKCIAESESKGLFGKLAKTFNNLANDEQKRKANFNAKIKYQKEKILDFLGR